MSVSVGLVNAQNIIENIIVVDDPGTFVPQPGYTIIDSPDVAIGRTVSGGIVIVPEPEDSAPVVPDQISALQMLSVLALNSYITEAEALDRSTLPAAFAPALASMSAEDQTVFKIRWANLTVVPRIDPMVAVIGAILSLTEAQIDDLFIQAAGL